MNIITERVPVARRRIQNARDAAHVREYHAAFDRAHELAQAQHDFIVGQDALRMCEPDRALSMPVYVEHLSAMIAERDAIDCQIARRGNALRTLGIDPVLYVGREM